MLLADQTIELPQPPAGTTPGQYIFVVILLFGIALCVLGVVYLWKKPVKVVHPVVHPTCVITDDHKREIAETVLAHFRSHYTDRIIQFLNHFAEMKDQIVESRSDNIRRQIGEVHDAVRGHGQVPGVESHVIEIRKMVERLS